MRNYGNVPDCLIFSGYVNCNSTIISLRIKNLNYVLSENQFYCEATSVILVQPSFLSVYNIRKIMEKFKKIRIYSMILQRRLIVHSLPCLLYEA